jgi:tricarballylate dehydrogenase
MADIQVLVVGAGNAGMCAALAARELGAQVTVLEAAPPSEHGGNSRYTAGAMRVVYSGVQDLRVLMTDLTDAEAERCDFGAYTRDKFFDDMARVTQHRADPDLVELLIDGSFETLRWMSRQGVRFAPSLGRQAFRVDGKFKFWGGLALEVVGGGPGLVEALHARARRNGIDIRCGMRATRLIHADGAVRGVVVDGPNGEEQVAADATILACGGFEANAAWRAQYLGPGWDLAKVRGTRHNLGDGIRMALEIGASPAGHWSGCHAVAWDHNAPEFGDLEVGDGFQKHSYPLGIMVNARGRRFVDEGADFRNYTYAKYGAEVLRQPNQVAWQIFDAKTASLLRDEYRIRQVSVARADSIRELAARMEGVDQEAFVRTVDEYNAAVNEAVPFDPAVLDGRGTVDLDPPKSNWAQRIDTPPFAAFAVTCGITFTFGGLRIDRHARVLRASGMPIRGLFACGELVGGLFYFNYPGGTGLTSGAVFGRIAGSSSVDRALAGALEP